MFIQFALLENKNFWEFFFNLENPVILSILIMAIILLCILIIMKYVINPLSQKYENEKNESIEKEKYRLALELHDTVLHNLTSMKNSAPVRTNQRESELINNTIDEINRICNELMPRELGENGLQEAVESLIESAIGKYKICFNTDIKIYGIRFLPELEINIFRIMQEAINNVLRHSHADSCSIKVGLKQDALNIIISDNGVGFDPCKILFSPEKKSFGLLSMKFRAVSVGGKINFDSVPGEGTIIHLEIPMNAKLVMNRVIFN